MPMQRLLPLGTVVECKGAKPGWENLRYMITGYYPVERGGGDSCNDYIITPWPLGYLNYEDGTQEMFYGCDEEGIERIEYLGAVDSFSKEKTDSIYEEALSLEGQKCPLAQGAEPMMLSYGDLPSTIGNLPFGKDEVLPLGTVVSTQKNGSQKVMIFQHSGTVKGERYDYGICAWPEGADPGNPNITLINHDEITAVHFRGYENALSQELAKRLAKKRRGSLFSRIIGKGKSW